MADKPSRALVIYGDGFVPLITPSHSHLHSFASLASCGFLSLRASPPSENENDRVVRELAQLLDAYDSYATQNVERGESQAKLSMATITERFMGLRAAFFTVGSSISSFAKKLGFSILQIEQLIEKNNLHNELQHEVPDELSIAAGLLRLLGFSEGEVLENSEFDLVFFHIRAGEKFEVLKDKLVIKTDIDWLNKVVGGILQLCQSGPEIASRLHFSLLLSYGPEIQSRCSSTLVIPMETNSDLSLLRPCQSHTMKGGKSVNDIRNHHPILIAQWQEAVTRRDIVKGYSFEEFKEAMILEVSSTEIGAEKLPKKPKLVNEDIVDILKTTSHIDFFCVVEKAMHPCEYS